MVGGVNIDVFIIHVQNILFHYFASVWRLTPLAMFAPLVLFLGWCLMMRLQLHSNPISGFYLCQSINSVPVLFLNKRELDLLFVRCYLLKD